MNGFHGMAPDAVRSYAGRLHAASGALEDRRGRLDAAVRTVSWAGPDAEDFRGRWREQATDSLTALCDQLDRLGDQALTEADEQDATSAPDGGSSGTDGGGTGTDGGGAMIPPAPAADIAHGYRQDDAPWMPDWLEAPLEEGLSGVAGVTSVAIGWGVDTGIDLVEDGLGSIGVRTDGIAQFQRDADHVGTILEDWATGERVPTYAELGAAALVTTGSAGVGVYEAVTGEDTPFLDDRPGGIVTDVVTDDGRARSPRDLQDLVADNDALRMDSPGQAPLEAGQIGIQEVRGASGGRPSYIVQVPPTEGAGATDVPGAYGEQGNSRDWGSNLRLVAGQHPAAMDDVQAAMAAADVPPGADVLIVGHSQGGIVANQLAADPSFNSTSGDPGTYNVTHTFSVGSPVQTVVPAQGTTRSVNVSHEAGTGLEGFSGDLIAETDLGGAQPGGTHLGAPNRHEVTLDPYPVTGIDPVPVLVANHDSMGSGHDPAGGYSGSLARSTASDPTLSALQDDLAGVYLGDGTYVARSQVVTVGRGEP
ncbi:WXG100 family type VII secretion target [Brachybacterium fresconis]|uniref:Alpha/beta hydrolase n=1 Tax=Brachybacterium fresconis TaxID=173363 RepID=A0ABS4YQ66_9MICO|nr:hypothetical protein [Brachybacterium fresconis]MBP2410730.1 hypothetical protein [Brachybacterium fresconis]